MKKMSLLALPLMVTLAACTPATSQARAQEYVLSTTPRSFVPSCTSMNVREIKTGTLLKTMSGNSMLTLNAQNALGSGAGTVQFKVECLAGGKVSSSGVFKLTSPGFTGTLLHLDSADFNDDRDSDIYEMATGSTSGSFMVGIRIDRFR